MIILLGRLERAAPFFIAHAVNFCAPDGIRLYPYASLFPFINQIADLRRKFCVILIGPPSAGLDKSEKRFRG